MGIKMEVGGGVFRKSHALTFSNIPGFVFAAQSRKVTGALELEFHAHKQPQCGKARPCSDKLTFKIFCNNVYLARTCRLPRL